MIIFFGPVASGKSMQGQLLAARHGWRWISAGQLLRDTHDPVILQTMQTGALVEDSAVNNLVSEALIRAKDIKHVILDGYPRTLEEAQWLIKHEPDHARSIQLVIVMDVPQEDLIERLQIRGRADDHPEAVAHRLKIYHAEIDPLLDYMQSQGIRVEHIDGHNTVGRVHDKIEAVLEVCSLA
ncbi:MAG TPA: nucleoside monophosphate kinase [Candidatus Acidoferrum sp.]|nr:nucleoside monophosphate kinase [Candidatus Acidoferrum sp.]